MNGLLSRLSSLFCPKAGALSAEERVQIQVHRVLTLIGIALLSLFGLVYDVGSPAAVDPQWFRLVIVGLLAGLFLGSYNSTYVRHRYAEWLRGILFVMMAWVALEASLNGFGGHYDIGLLLAYASFAVVVGLGARTIEPLLWFLGFGILVTGVGTALGPPAQVSLGVVLGSMVVMAVAQLIAGLGTLSTHNELAEREARYRAIAESARDAIVTIDAESTIQYANPAVMEVFGYAPSDLVGESLTILMPDRFHERHQAAVDQFVETEEQTMEWTDIEFPGLRKDGDEIDLNISFSKYEEEGELRFEAVIRDITEKKRREKALRRHRSLLKQTQRLAGAWEVDLRTEEMRWSDEVYRIHEVPTGTTVDIEEGIQYYAPEVRDEIREAFRRCVEKHEPYDLELPIVTAEGNRRWVHTVGAPLKADDDEVVKVAGAVQDITDRKEAERALAETKARYETLIEDVFEGLPGAVFVLDAAFEVVWVNQAVEEFFGIDGEEIVGKSKPRLIETTIKHIFEAPKAFAERALGAYEDDRYPCQFECHVQAGSGRVERWLRHRSRPIQHGRYEGGRVEVYTDITVQKRNERELAQRSRQLDQLRKSVTDVVWMSPPDKSKIEFVSEAYEEIWGRSTEHLKQHPESVVEAIHPEDRERIRSALAEQKQRPEDYAETYRVVQPDGEVRWVRDRSAGVYDERGELVRIIGVATDITERKRREEDLERRHEKLEALYEATNGLLGAETRDGVSQSILNLVNDLLGYPVAAVHFLDAGKLVPVEVSPEYSDPIPEHTAFPVEGDSAVSQVFRDGKPRIFDDLRRAGDPFDYDDVRATAIMPMGEYGTISVGDLEVGTIDPYDRHLFEIISTYATLVLDRIDQEKTLREERDLLDRILETSPAAVAVCNREGEFLQASGRAEDVLGLERDEVTNRTYNDPEWAITKPDGEPMPDEELPFARVMATEEPVHDIEHAIEWPDGTRRLLSVSGAPLRSDAGELEGAVFHIQDITDRRERERELRQTKRLLEKTLESLNEAVLVVNPEGQEIVTCNSAVRDIFGYEPDELTGRSTEILHVDRDAFERFGDLSEPRLDATGYFRTEYKMRRKEGGIIDTEHVVTPLEGDEWTDGVVSVVRDITDRKRREHQLDAIVENTTNPIYIKDREGRYQFVNEAAADVFGLTPPDVIGKTEPELFDEESAADIRADDLHIMNTGETIEEERTRFVDGEELVYIDNKYPYRTEDGEIVGVMGISQDITDRKNEARRREQVISRVTDAIVEVDSDWQFTLVNDQAEELYDMDEEELLGENFWDVFSGAVGTRFEEEYRTVMRTREHTRFVEYYPGLDGWFDIQVYPNADGGVAFYFEEITDQKERERRMEAVFNHTYQLTGLIKPDGTLIEANDTALRFGDLNEEDVLGHSIWNTFWFEGKESRQQRLKEAVDRAREGEFVRYEEEVRGADESRIIDFSLRPVTDDFGEVMMIVPEGRDITERKERERALVEAKEEAERMNRLKSACLANMSHEIRTPLTTILGFAEAIGEEVSPGEKERVHQFSHLIQKSGRRLMETLTGVLNLSKLQAGEMEFSMEPVDLSVEVEETRGQFRASANERGVHLEVESERTVMVWADVAAVQIVVRNLVSNGIKYTNEGGTVWVRAYAEEDAGVLEVEDTGIGMEPYKVEDLFEPFQQESQGTSREYEGTGLGLAVTKQAVEEMGGSIDVSTEKGVGTSFIVRLPKVHDDV